MDFIIRNLVTNTFRFYTINSPEEIPDILTHYESLMRQFKIPLDKPIHCILEWEHDFSKETNSNDTNTTS